MCHVSGYLNEMANLHEDKELRFRADKKDGNGEEEHKGKSTIPKNKRERRHRIFKHKESYLTELMDGNEHIQTLFNLGVVMTLMLWIVDIMKNSAEKGRFYLDMSTYHVVFGPWQNQLRSGFIWVILIAAYFLIHPIFKIWVKLHHTLGRAADIVFIVLFCVYNVVAHTAVILLIMQYNFDTAPALFLSIEQTRFTLQSHSFIRENAYKVLWPWNEDDETGPPVWFQGQMSPKIGKFSQYLYFTFAPTLLYRDHYPMLPRIRWMRAIWYLLQFGGILSCTIIILKNFIGPHFASLPDHPLKHGLLALTSCILVGTFFMIMAGVCFLHLWQNFGGELTRFADRQCYGPWWRCVEFRTFYRDWNLLVHDWIHCYIYEDLLALLGRRFQTIAVLATTLMSSIVHEYILATAVKFFLPLLTLEFSGFGVIVYYIRLGNHGNKEVMNTLFLAGISIGFGIMVWGYGFEMYTRYFCPKEPTFANGMWPRFFECWG